MVSKNIHLWAAVLLMFGGLINLIPALYDSLRNLAGGQPWIPIIIGMLSVLVAIIIFAGDKQK